MDPETVLATEFVIATGINIFGALKKGAMPWPPTIVGSAIAFAILWMLSAVSPMLAMVLASGFLLALLLGNVLQGGKISDTFGALPPDGTNYDTLHFRGKVT